MLFVTIVAPIISYFFLLRQKKKKDIRYQYPRLLLRALSHPTVTAFPHTPPHPTPPPITPVTLFPAVWMHYLESSIAHAFQAGVRLLSCHVALTRVHDRFQPPSATNPSPLKSTPILRRLSMVQDYVHLPREIYFSVSVTLPPLSNPIDYNFYSLKLPKHFNYCNDGQCVKKGYVFYHALILTNRPTSKRTRELSEVHRKGNIREGVWEKSQE
jgi:hypothetical protein